MRTFVRNVSSGTAIIALVMLAMVVSSRFAPSGAGPLAATSRTGGSSGLEALDHYSVSVFAQATKDFWNPDSIIYGDDHNVFVGYQNTTKKDGSDNKSSTVVEYNREGDVLREWPVLGHVDGLRQNPNDETLWVLSNEDGNPHLTVIDPEASASKQYSMTSVNGGGGFDDIAFIGGEAFLSASNPTLNGSGQNTFPAIVTATLGASSVNTTPFLMGNATATDLVSNSTVTLNEIDPDSLYVTPKGQLQLDNQGGSELVLIDGPTTNSPTVTRLGIGNQQDDTIFPGASEGTLLVSDTPAGVIYKVRSESFQTGLYYSTAPADSGVAGFVGTVDPATGTITPIVIGLVGPHGEAFIKE